MLQSASVSEMSGFLLQLVSKIWPVPRPQGGGPAVSLPWHLRGPNLEEAAPAGGGLVAEARAVTSACVGVCPLLPRCLGDDGSTTSP